MMLGQAILFAATVTMGLNAGFFYFCSIGLMPGLAHTDDETFVPAMRQVNRAVLNPWLALILGGPGVFAIAAAALQLGADDRSALPWTIAGFASYLAMLAITLGANVPLNNQLDTAQPATATDFAFGSSALRGKMGPLEHNPHSCRNDLVWLHGGGTCRLTPVIKTGM